MKTRLHLRLTCKQLLDIIDSQWSEFLRQEFPSVSIAQITKENAKILAKEYIYFAKQTNVSRLWTFSHLGTPITTNQKTTIHSFQSPYCKHNGNDKPIVFRDSQLEIDNTKSPRFPHTCSVCSMSGYFNASSLLSMCQKCNVFIRKELIQKCACCKENLCEGCQSGTDMSCRCGDRACCEDCFVDCEHCEEWGMVRTRIEIL